MRWFEAIRSRRSRARTGLAHYARAVSPARPVKVKADMATNPFDVPVVEKPYHVDAFVSCPHGRGAEVSR